MTGRTTDVSRFLRQHCRTDKGELAQKLIEQFDEMTGSELQAALDSRRPVLVLAQSDERG